MEVGLFVLRIVVGLLMSAHGAQKLFGAFGGYGIEGTGGFLETLGFRPGRAFAVAAGTSEFAGGLLIAAGLLGPVGPALVLATMIVAMGTVHLSKGLFATTDGVELPLLYAIVAVTLIFTGFGEYSVDAVAGLNGTWTPAVSAAVLTAGVLGGAANLLVRRPARVEA